MTEQLTFIEPSTDRELKAVRAMLQGFLDWHGGYVEGDRKPVEWFARQVKDYLQDPQSTIWEFGRSMTATPEGEEG